MELVEFALNHSIDVMMALGGPLQDAPDTYEDGVFGGGALDPEERLWVSDNVEPAQGFLTNTDRISRAQVAATLESSLQEYLSGQTQFAQFGEVVRRQLQNAPSLEGWACDVFTEGENSFEKPAVNQEQQQRQLQRQWVGLRTRQRVLWTFVRSFLDYCHTISMLDPGLHRKVLEAVAVLLRPPSQAQHASGMFLHQVPEWDSAWYNILHHSKDSPTCSLDQLRQFLSVEWRLFLVNQGMSRGESDAAGAGVSSSALRMPAASTLFV